jgi:hypothetical protein
MAHAQRSGALFFGQWCTKDTPSAGSEAERHLRALVLSGRGRVIREVLLPINLIRGGLPTIDSRLRLVCD